MRITHQSFLLALLCIFLESAEAQNKRLKTYEIEKDKDNHARISAGQKYNIRGDVSDEEEDGKRKCKGKYCRSKNNDEDEGFRSRREENDWKYMKSYKPKYEKYGNDDKKDKKSKTLNKEKAGRMIMKNSSKRDSTDDDDEEKATTNSKKRIIENVIVVKNKLGHLKEKIENIQKTEFDSEKRKKYDEKTRITHRNDKDDKKSFKSKKNGKKHEESDSSEEQKPYVKIKHKPFALDSEENTGTKIKKYNTVSRETPNRKKSKKTENGGENRSDELESVERNIHSDEDIEKKAKSDEKSNACDESQEVVGAKNNNCSDEEDDGEESNFHTKKYKFSIKYAHEKKKGVPNRDHHFVKKIHGVDKKKHRFGDEDDDSDEQEELPKRLYHVMDDEE